MMTRQAAAAHTLRLSFMIVVIIALPACSRKLVPSPNLYTQSDVNPYADVIPEYQNNRVEVIYATDRLPEKQREGERLKYSWKRSPSLAFGVTTVEFGHNVSWDDLVKASRSARREVSLPIRVTKTEELFRLSATPRLYAMVDGEVVDDPEEVAHDEEVARQLQKLVGDRLAMTDTKDVYIFVHGFNNSFEYSAGVIAEIWHFLGREGVPIVYSWPAGAGGNILRAYNRDRESGEFTVYHLKQFAKILENTPGLERIHVIAHSRGTDVLTEAVRELAIENRAKGKKPRRDRFATLVLAAADLDFQVTQQRLTAERVPMLPGRVVIYVSEEDKALGASRWLSRSGNRVGSLKWEDLDERAQQRNKLAGEHIDFIDANVSAGFVGHSYFYGNPAVLSDLILAIKFNYDVGAANGRPLEPINPIMWEIRNEYPYGLLDADGRILDGDE